MKRFLKIFRLVVAFLGIIMLASCAFGKFSARKVSKIDLGDSKVEVEEVLGEPYEYEQGASSYEYFSKNYIKLKEKIEKNADKLLEASSEKELEKILKKDQEYTEKEHTMEYQYIYITFRDDMVSSILLDTKKVGETSQKKTPKKTTILECEILQYLKFGEVTYETYFEDGSYIKGISSVSVAEGEDVSEVGNEVKIHWSDTFVDQYTETTRVVENEDLVAGDGYYVMDNTLHINKDNVSHFSSDVKGITQISVEEGVTKIPDEAYSCFSDVRKVTLPTTLTSIGKDAFVNTAYIQNENNYENGLLYNNNYLLAVKPNYSGKLKLKDNTKLIAEDVFSNSNNLTSVYYDGSIEDWCKIIFNGWASTPMSYGEHFYIKNSNNVWEEVTSIEIPNTITKIGAYQFYGFDNVTSITIPDSVTSIGECSFYNCNSLTSITIPNKVKSISKYAFKGCAILTSVMIGNSVTSIEYSAFYGCSSLTSITIPNSVRSIEHSAFYECTSLTSVTIGNGVKTIKEEAFKDCSSLKNVYYEGTIKDWCNIQFKNIYSNPKLYANHFYMKNNNDEWGEVTSIEIPNTITEIGAYQFYGFSSVTSITIPSSVTSIGQSAFSQCSNLTNIEIPNSVTSIGRAAFYDCEKLTSITIPECVTSIGESAFYNCSSLTSITIPESVTSIGDYAFSGCSSLISITIPDSVSSMGKSAFYRCSSLTSVTIGNSVTSIGESAFYECSSLQSITICNSVTSIAESSFKNCGNITYIYYDGSIEDWCNRPIKCLEFSSASNSNHFYLRNSDDKWEEVTNIEIPNTVAKIGDYQFYNFNNVTSITIPDSVASIGKAAFLNCRSLTSLTIGNSVTSIGESAFWYCNSLTSVTIPNSVISIGEYAFYNCSSLPSITIPNSVTSIGSGAFSRCDNIIKATIPANAISYLPKDHLQEVIITGGETIRTKAFYNCSSLTSLTIGNSVTSIGEEAFKGCSSLPSITIPNSVTSIEFSAFRGCSSLTSVTIGNSVTSIGEDAFYECSSLQSIMIGNSVTSIGEDAFYNCSSLTNITIPNSVTSIGKSAFKNCSSLTSITIPFVGEILDGTNNTHFGYIFGASAGDSDNSAYVPSSLREVVITGGTSIGKSAFYNCYAIISVVIPESVTSIGEYAFWYCDSLKNVYYEGTSAQWSKINIEGSNTDLTTVTVYYYSEKKPTTSGNYWHYVDGVVTKW